MFLLIFRESEGNINGREKQRLVASRTHTLTGYQTHSSGTALTAQARTRNPLGCGTVLQPDEQPSQGTKDFFFLHLDLQNIYKTEVFHFPKHNKISTRQLIRCTAWKITGILIKVFEGTVCCVSLPRRKAKCLTGFLFSHVL